MEFKFNYDNKDYILNEENCEGVFFDDSEVNNFDLSKVLSVLNEGEEVNFSKEYYVGKCSCDKQEALNKYYLYLEYHFYIYTKNNEYVISTICKEYENTSYNRLFSTGKIDNSYIVNVTVCPECGTYSVEVEECEV